MMNLVVDLETIPDPDVPFDAGQAKFVGRQPWLLDRPEGLILTDARPFPPVVCHKIVTIGYALFNGYNCAHLRVADQVATDEEAGLTTFLGFLEEHKPTIITWNGRGFDAPVWLARAMKYGFSVPWWFNSRDTRYRYSDKGHFDLKDHVTDFGATKAYSQDQMCKLLGMPGKPKSADGITDGNKVADLVAAGKQDEVDAYCLTDVMQLSVIWLRYELLRGNLTREEYKRAFASVWHTAQRSASLPVSFMREFDVSGVGFGSLCCGEWISGSGGHRVHTANCTNLASFTDEPYGYCGEHMTPEIRKQAGEQA